jgi:DNA-binding MarR family transcriptional regulator
MEIRLTIRQMKNILFLLLFTSQLLYGQSRIITHEILYQELKKASGDVLIDFYSHENHENKKFFNIGLITKNVINEPPEFEVYKGKHLQDDITTDTATLKKIIEIFESKGLLINLYVRVDTNYVNVNSANDRINENGSKLFISLFYPAKKEFEQVYIPINEKSAAIELLDIVSKLFDKNEKKIFEEMIDALK